MLKTYIKLNIYAGMIIGIMEIVSYSSLGEFVGMNLHLGRMDLVILLFLQVATIALTYPVFIWTKEKRVRLRRGFDFRFEIQPVRMHCFMFLLLCVNILFSLESGNGVLGRTVTSGFSFLFNIIQVAPLFPIYYVCARNEKKPVYWLNVILFSIFRFMCGWSGHILMIAFLELFLRIKHGRQNLLVKTMLRFNGILVVSLFMVGSWLYCLVFPFKFAIRYGAPFSSVAPLAFSEGIAALLSRLTNFPATVAAAQNHAVMAELYQKQGKLFWEVASVLSPLLPRFLMPNKEYRGLSNIVKWAVYPDLSRDTGTGYNAFVYWVNILEIDLTCFVVAAMVFALLFVLSKNIIFAFDDGSRDVEIIYFTFLVELFSTANLSSVFGYGCLPLVYSIPVMTALGIIKIKWKPLTVTGSADLAWEGVMIERIVHNM